MSCQEKPWGYHPPYGQPSYRWMCCSWRILTKKCEFSCLIIGLRTCEVFRFLPVVFRHFPLFSISSERGPFGQLSKVAPNPKKNRGGFWGRCLRPQTVVSIGNGNCFVGIGVIFLCFGNRECWGCVGGAGREGVAKGGSCMGKWHWGGMTMGRDERQWKRKRRKEKSGHIQVFSYINIFFGGIELPKRIGEKSISKTFPKQTSCGKTIVSEKFFEMLFDSCQLLSNFTLNCVAGPSKIHWVTSFPHELIENGVVCGEGSRRGGCTRWTYSLFEYFSLGIGSQVQHFDFEHVWLLLFKYYSNSLNIRII